ncbi:hypothetical protein BJX63DRAFT_387133 [Aspergillus granulosus]|uniref:Uncharacterized protein n=1 Tax=Aspergillus granulosus TaxID=176169 RepID=A0ABR4HPQ4_9EURO
MIYRAAMGESTFGFMPQVFFVDDFPYRKPARPHILFESTSRSHAARVAHEKRKAAKTSKKLQVRKGEPRDEGLHGVPMLYNARIADMPISLKIFWKVVVPGVRPLCTLFNTRCVTNEEWLPYMAQDVFFHAGAAAMHAAHDQLVNPEFRTRPSRIIFEHRGKAMAQLREHMARGEGVTDAMLLAVCFLALLERRYDEMDAHNTHKHMMGTLVVARGGLDALSPYTRSVLMQYEFPWAMETGASVLPRTRRRQPRYPFVDSTGIPLKRIRNIPEGFAVLALQGMVSAHLLTTLERFNYFASRDFSPDGDSLQAGYVYDDFWDAFPPLSFHDSGEPSLDNLLFLCLLVYASVQYSVIPPVNNIAVCMRSSLRAKLLQCRRIRESAEEECLCWIWTVAVSSWRQIDGTLDKPGMELQMAQRIRFGYLGGQAEHEKILSKFFWDDGCQKTCRELFNIDLSSSNK